jgi:O-glycosyl hydrolase
MNKSSITISVDGAKRFQQIEGIGVNANTRSWNRAELPPALNLLLDSMKANIWRVIVETVEKWEDVNDNEDPFSFNWEYYNKLYETPKFTKAWEMIGYLNQHGITDNLMINFMGFAPPWMGIKVIKPEFEDEYVEMITSFFYYAIKTKHLKFGLIAPTNESDHHKFSEGPHLDGKQHARIVRKLIDRMEGLGVMGNIRIVAPDNASNEAALKSFVPALIEDPVVMSKIAYWGFHTYGGYQRGLNELIRQSPYPKTTFWITEWNAWRNGLDDGLIGVYDYNFAGQSVYYLLDLLRNGATACLAWEGYDSYYEHHAPSLFSYWGILGYNADSKTYTPRKHLPAISQVSRFVVPASWRISVTDVKDSVLVLAFHHAPSKTTTITGINMTDKPITIDGSLMNLPDIDYFELYRTNKEEDLHRGENVAVKNKAFRTSIPPNTIFTLTTTAISAKKDAKK